MVREKQRPPGGGLAPCHRSSKVGTLEEYTEGPTGSRGFAEMRDYHINVFYSEEDGGYIADIPDLQMCSAFGRSPEEAAAEVAEARHAWLATARESGKPIPRPAAHDPR